MMPDTFQSHSPEETDTLAASLARTLVPGDVVCLYGDLGAGKTRFVKGVAAALGVDPDLVNSPTFTLINEYKADIPIYHFDCYRIEDVREVLEFGGDEYLYGEGICLIEWPERIESIIPPECIRVQIEKTGPTGRLFRFQRHSE